MSCLINLQQKTIGYTKLFSPTLTLQPYSLVVSHTARLTPLRILKFDLAYLLHYK